ncbi:MAG: hypothetical protein EA381_14525 [Planctomycetaceae bacterium]|nr:MAG: hypothetical protein EA381_14525 [Planctomycetaceae bacterium]
MATALLGIAAGAGIGLPADRCAGLLACPPVRVAPVTNRRVTKPVAPATVSTIDARSLRRFTELQSRVDRYVEHCRRHADQAGERKEATDRELEEHNRTQAESLCFLTFLRRLLEQPGDSLQVADRTFTREEIGAVLATKLDEHQQQAEVGRSLRLEAAAAQARRHAADEQAARWRQQQADLIARVDALRTDSNLLAETKSIAATRSPTAASSPQSSDGDDAIRQAERLAEELERLLPPEEAPAAE